MGRKRKCIGHTPITAGSENLQSRKGQVYCANCTTKGKPTKIQLCGTCGQYHSTHNFGRESAHCSAMGAPAFGRESAHCSAMGAPAQPHHARPASLLRGPGGAAPEATPDVGTPRSSFSAFNPKKLPGGGRSLTSSFANSFSGDESGSSGEENYAASIQNSPKADRTILKKRAAAAAARASAATAANGLHRRVLPRTTTIDRVESSIKFLQQNGQAPAPLGAVGHGFTLLGSPVAHGAYAPASSSSTSSQSE